MKYNSSNKPLVCMQTQSTCYKGTSKMTIKGILWHATGANNKTLKRYVQPSNIKPSADTYNKTKWLEVLGTNSYSNDWNHIDHQAGLNAWIGALADGTVTSIQTMPWEYKPWGCGSGSKGSCNDGWIQFEICEDSLTDKTYFDKIYNEACELTAYLCDIFKIDPNGTVIYKGVEVPTILCHQDSYKLGLGSNHADVYHWFSKYGKNMTTVRADVAAILKAAGSSVVAVKTYKVVTAINKYATASDAVAQQNAKSDKLAAGTYYVYNKYPNGVNGMYNISTDKTGASAGSWINPKENVIKESTTTATTTADKLYRVRKSKDDAKSQVGAYSSLEGAKNACQAAGEGYHVFDWNYTIVHSYTAPITLTSIAITTKPTKTTYYINEAFDAAGLVVTATYSNKSTKVITGYKTSGFSSTKAGTVTVTVTFEGKTSTFTVTIKEKEVVKTVKVYDLDYPEKTKIVDKSINRTDADCVKAIKKIISNNKDFDIEIAKAFFKLAPKYGIDPMMAISQSILETGWFKYSGSAVTPDQHNYCGLGVTSNGVTGAKFNTIEDGVTAQLQHLFAYGCKDGVPAGETILDPRFSLVTRGIAPYWQQLAGRWACPGYDTKTYDTPEKAMAAGNTYGQKIRALYNQIIATTVTNTEIATYFNKENPSEALPDGIEEPKNSVLENDLVTDPEQEPYEEPVYDETEAPEVSKEYDENFEKDTENEVYDEYLSDFEDSEVPDETSGSSKNRVIEILFNCLGKLVQFIMNLINKGE